MEMTVNALLSMQKALKQRQGQLEQTKMHSTSRSRRINIDKTEQIDEPTYDIKKLDKKVTDINKALLKIDQEVKRSNAATVVKLAEINFDDLMSEIE